MSLNKDFKPNQTKLNQTKINQTIYLNIKKTFFDA